MFERYTEKARRVIFFARYEASRFGTPCIETEQLLLGMARDDAALLLRFLTAASSEESIRDQILARTPMGESVSTSVDLPLSDESKRVLEYGAEEAARLGHQHIGCEHLLLGLLREENCFAAQMLRERGADIEEIRKKLAAQPPADANPFQSGQFGTNPPGHIETLRHKMEFRSPSGPPRPAEPGAAKVPFHEYTEKARRSIFFARYEAGQLGSPVIETEHLLLGMLREMPAELYRFFASGTSIEVIRKKIQAHAKVRENVPAGQDLPFSQEIKRVLAYAGEEAEKLKHPRVGLEHLLLGLLREEACFAAQMLRERGADVDRIRKALADNSDAHSSGDFGDYT